MNNQSNHILNTPIEFLKGVGPIKGDLLKKELSIFTFEDLLNHFPHRHIDKTQVSTIDSINYSTEFVQVKARLISFEIIGQKAGKRLVAFVKDKTGILELIWFQGVNYMEKYLQEGADYFLYGKTSFFNGKPQMAHPEMEVFVPQQLHEKIKLEPIYPTTEKLKARGLNAKQIGKLTEQLFAQVKELDIAENLPFDLITKYQLSNRFQSFQNIHFPKNETDYQQALRRLKFEELFIAQLRYQLIRVKRHKSFKGFVFNKVGDYFNNFYNHHLPFKLTNAQKRVLKEIRNDTAKGIQMNRLLQGDVGSGKTIVALLCMLLAADNGFQSCLMAPTEILAQQHYHSLQQLLVNTDIKVALLTGSIKAKERRKILEDLANDDIHFVVGTHALIEDVVVFKNLGMAIVDEQHRFGVAQRAALWKKNSTPPHVLVMTATPIPRTLAMTAYGDLDYSVIDELPPGRKPIETIHRTEHKRAQIMDFVKTEIAKGRQAYFVYPLIEESEKVNYEDLMQGYEQVKSFFPEPKYFISMVHGKMKNEIKETNMQRFINNDTQILVGTTVIEVGVNVPNASVMVIESAEKFGLSQLHQLRGRVGRGSEKSFCILLTGSKATNVSKERINIMCSTNDGFKIAEKDLELRGPGEIDGTKQSGALNFKLASIVNDKNILEIAKQEAEQILTEDIELCMEKNIPLKSYLKAQKGKTLWSKIS